MLPYKNDTYKASWCLTASSNILSSSCCYGKSTTRWLQKGLIWEWVFPSLVSGWKPQLKCFMRQSSKLMNQYMIRLHYLAEPCQFGNLHDEMLRDCLVLGSRDKGARARIVNPIWVLLLHSYAVWHLFGPRKISVPQFYKASQVWKMIS